MFLSKSSRLGTKITLLFAILISVCIIIFSWKAVHNLSEMSSSQLNAMEQESTQAALMAMNQGGKIAAGKVKELIKQNFSASIMLAELFSQTATPYATPLTRQQMRDANRATLAAYPLISSLYTQLEANAYDNLDEENLKNYLHSSDIGSVEIYWLRDNGELVYQHTEDASLKYIETLIDNGMRESEWYLCPRDSKKPCILDPYLYEYEQGKFELVTSLTAPIIKDGKFLGIVGGDINLPIVQSWLKEESEKLFAGKSMLTLVSQNNIVVASTEDVSSVGSAANKTLHNLLSDKTTNNVDNDIWHITVSIPIDEAQEQWQLVVSVPKSVALASLIKLRTAAEEEYSAAVIGLIITAVVFIFLATLMSIWLARSISSPIETVSKSVQNLSSHEGDLTQTVNIDNHKELILLAEGINKFMAKLADMINSSKNYSKDLVGLMKSLDNGAMKVGEDTDNQQANLDNIATAVNEMSATAIEVAQLAQNTADNASNANSILGQTQSSLEQTLSEAQVLSENMTDTSDQIEKVANRTQNITGIVATIQGIAEQTNLLALNAAIEAARAGELGRGFAVVADEVRSLASRTQISTQEIGDLIQSLQTDVDSAVAKLNEIQGSVGNTVESTQSTYTQLAEGVESINTINDSSAQVATAAEQQSQVSEEINQQVVYVSDSCKNLAEMGNQLKEMSSDAQRLITEMDAQLSQLKS